mgnify:CR=1 FL=1
MNKKDSLAQPKSGRVADMIVPILVLIVTAILGMLYNGGYWSNDPSLHTITAALGNCVAAQALVWGSFCWNYYCTFYVYTEKNHDI